MYIGGIVLIWQILEYFYWLCVCVIRVHYVLWFYPLLL